MSFNTQTQTRMHIYNFPLQCLFSCVSSSSPNRPNEASKRQGFGPSISETTSRRNFGQRGGFCVSTNEVLPKGKILEAVNLPVYTLGELKRTTENFQGHTILGEGEFGMVHKGWVHKKTLNPAICGHGMAVAVKKYSLNNMQALEEWQTELNFLGSISHPNIIKILGYCRGECELFLVSEFMAMGSLEHHLFRRGEAFNPLSWSLRLKIAVGAARGLAFLHSTDKQVIYRNFKTSNILLDSGYIPKLSGFGLARDGPIGEDTHVTTGLTGNYPYSAPEYISTGHLYVKSDTYGFGVVLLEMLSGRQAFDTNRPSREQYLVHWAKPLLSDHRKLHRVMDPGLKGQYPSREALLVAELVLRCLNEEHKSRPSMNEVVETLEQIESIKKVKDSRASSSSS